MKVTDTGFAFSNWQAHCVTPPTFAANSTEKMHAVMVNYFKDNHDSFAGLIFNAITSGDEERFDELIGFGNENGFNFDFDKLYYNKELEFKITLLAHALNEENLVLAQKLLDLGADIDNTDYFTPLEISIMDKKIPNIKFCLENGANPNIQSDHGDIETNIFPPYLEFMRTSLGYSKRQIAEIVDLFANAQVKVQLSTARYSFSLDELAHADLIAEWQANLNKLSQSK